MKKNLLIFLLILSSSSVQIQAQQSTDFDIIQNVIQLQDLQDLKSTLINHYGEPDESFLAFPDDESKKDVYTFVYKLPGEIVLNLTVYKRSYIFAAILVYPPKFHKRINAFLDELVFRRNKFYKPDTKLSFQSYSSTEKAKQEFHILQIIEEVD